MELETIRCTTDGDVLIATIDRAGSPLNTVDEQLHRDLGELVRRLKRERTARAVVLTGGEHAFSAGGDFSWFPMLDNLAVLDDLRRDAKQLIWDLLDVELPIVAAVNGPAIGLGASIALLCDLVVIGENAVIADPHVKVGIVAGDGGTAIWPLLIGPARAKQYLMTGDAIRSAEALRLGLVNEIAADGEVLARALQWATRLAAGAPLAVRGTKIAVNQQLKRALLDSYDLSTAMEISTFLSEDHREALAAMEQKRRPVFRGR